MEASMIAPDELSNLAVQAFVSAVNAGDRSALLGILTPDATMSDDGTDKDLTAWIDKEIFSAHGHMDVESESDGGLGLVVSFRNDTWGEMRTAWRFTVIDDKVSRFETGQA
jgi:hypothetical protein